MSRSFTVATRFLDWGAAVRTLPGEQVSGDLHVVRPFPKGALIAVVDGLGHGAEAGRAAQVAAATLAKHASEPVIPLVRRCHEVLRGTRGAVMTLASFNRADHTLTWMGVGNVEGVLVRADPTTSHPRERVMVRAGVVGYELPYLRAAVLPMMRDDTLVLATDGIRSDFADSINVRDSPQQLADRLLADFAKGNDDALVLVARYRPR